MTPVIALIGRPNVGKSTLFNRLTKTKDALVGNLAGLTRDRQYGNANFGKHKFIIVDTGGLSETQKDSIEEHMTEQSWQAVEEADLVCLILDAKDLLNADDSKIVAKLRKYNKPVVVVVNKIDNRDETQVLTEFASLGFEHNLAISAVQGRGIRQMMQKIVNILPEQLIDEEFVELSDEELENAENSKLLEEKEVKVAIIGRPNVGKSTLVNRLLGEERVVAFDEPGTTRDSIYIPFTANDKNYTLIDTAGVRKRGRINQTIEKFSVVKTLQAITDANVVIFMVDAHENLVDQDLNLLGFIIEKGCALVIAVNKWDGLDSDKREMIKDRLEQKLLFAEFAQIHFISALHGSGVGLLFNSVEQAYQAATARYQTSRLTVILDRALQAHQPPLINGRRIKLRYAHLGGVNPPLIIIHGTQTDNVPNAYTRYLERAFRNALDVVGTPIRIEYRNSDNPYKDKHNKLTDRQVNKKRRLMSHHKKQEKKRKDKKR